jgi:F-type H+-transporting ATPase subunit a
MSAAATAGRAPAQAPKDEGKGLSTKMKVLIGFATLVALAIVMNLLFPSEGKNEEFKPQNEFKLDNWIELKLGPLDMSINKAVLYLFLACALTVAVMTYIAKRMQDRPNRIQTAVEVTYDLTRNQITRGNMDDRMARKWFPFIATLFFFILISNIIGYIPLPTNTEHKVDVLGVAVPTFAIYAATANISIPLVLTLIVWFAYHIEGIRAHGFIGYLKSWVPAGVSGPAAIPIFVIEAISHFVRIISLSVRLFANLLAGHLLILFMGGGLVVLLGLAALGVFTLPIAIGFFMFEVVLIAGLQAFIFATLTSIYLGGATASHH